MHVILADAIDLPIVLGLGVAVLVPIMAFQVFVEALVLRKWFERPWDELCRLTFRANCWSLLAGIPVKMLNALIYSALLPRDLPGYFAAYPYATSLGIFIYFVATLGVEIQVAKTWLKGEGLSLPVVKTWKAVLAANLVTYAVLAPTYYLLTLPTSQMPNLARGINWTSNPAEFVVFVAPENGYLKSVRLGNLQAEVVVPHEVRDFLLAPDLSIILYRGKDDNLHIFDRRTNLNKKIWETTERFLMNQVAFSPSGSYVAIASENEQGIRVVDVSSGRTSISPIPQNVDRYFTVAWTTNEARFLVKPFGKQVPGLIAFGPDLRLHQVDYSASDHPGLLECYGRVGGGSSFGGGSWRAAYGRDVCGELEAYTEPGLGSSIRVWKKTPDRSSVFSFYVNPGMLHLSLFYFQDVTFLPSCRELIFEATDHLYLLDLAGKRVGTISTGKDFITFSAKYQKQL